MPNNEPFIATNMAEAVRDMAQQLARYSQHADEERAKLRDEVNATVEAMRKDVFRVIVGLQINATQHRDEHTIDRQERAADSVARFNRQLTQNLWMGTLTVLVVLNLLLVGFIVIRVALVMYGR